MCVLLGDDDAVKKQCLKDFQNDVAIFEFQEAAKNKSAALQATLRRHVFQLLSNKQYMLAFKEVGYDLQ